MRNKEGKRRKKDLRLRTENMFEVEEVSNINEKKQI